MTTLKKNHLVEKRNILNEIRSNSMTIQELRFFSIYLSKINVRDISTRVVRFQFDDFKAIMELNNNIRIPYMKSVTNSLLSKVVNVPDEHGGYTGFQLFKRCKVSRDDNGEWYVEIDAHDDSLPLMFEFKNKYFTYQLWNALRLKSSNQLRMYEILKQYQTVGYRILTIENLKALLGINKNEYDGRWNNFKKYVLDSCQQSLAEHTDIKFTYEPHGKRGKGGKILSLKFIIEKNSDYTDQITLFEFIEEQKLKTDTSNDNDFDDDFDDDNKLSAYENRMIFLSGACNDEFSLSEIKVLHDKILELLPLNTIKKELDCYNYLTRKYRYMLMQNEKNKINNRFKYMLSIIGKD